MSLADLALGDWVRQAVAFPAFRQSKQFRFRHLNDREHLTAFRDQGVICDPANLESAPEPGALEPIEPAANAQTVTELGGSAIVDFGPDNDGILLGLCHFDQLHPELLGEERARSLDEAQ